MPQQIFGFNQPSPSNSLLTRLDHFSEQRHERKWDTLMTPLSTRWCVLNGSAPSLWKEFWVLRSHYPMESGTAFYTQFTRIPCGLSPYLQPIQRWKWATALLWPKTKRDNRRKFLFKTADTYIVANYPITSSRTSSWRFTRQRFS